MSIDLSALGWTEDLAQASAEHEGPHQFPGRVCREDRERYEVLTVRGALPARLSGGLRHQVRDRGQLPVVGDWVVLRRPAQDGTATVQIVLPRHSQFARKAVVAGGPQYGPGRTETQVLAANFDLVFLVSGLDRDFNLRRIERYVTVAWNSGATPVIILNKSDLCSDPQIVGREAAEVAPGVAVHVVSATSGEGLAQMRAQLRVGVTGVLLGSSGVGKSTLINTLIGEERQSVRAVRAKDERGRHTTTARELIQLPGGGLLIDTPGLRELQPWEDDGALDATFADIVALARDCRFRDCRHEREPGCAVQQAVESGVLAASRLANYQRLQREFTLLAVRKDLRARRDVTGRRQTAWQRNGERPRRGRTGRAPKRRAWRSEQEWED